jgi:NAD(P)-dependent dehydrogenase (short-subunit alcohol dehydrogenase family)
VIVSVAAIRPHKPFWEISYEEWHEVFEVNLHSTLSCKGARSGDDEARRRREHRGHGWHGFADSAT